MTVEFRVHCRDCDVRSARNRECPKHWFATTPEGEAALNILCAGYISPFKSRANDCCPCGSFKWLKHCYGESAKEF